MGGLRERLPITFWTFFAATLALCGIPPFAGFMSKDAIIWDSFRPRPSAAVGASWLGAGITDVLHVPPGLPDVLRRVPRHARAGASSARIAALDDARAGGARRAVGSRRFREAARLPRAPRSVRPSVRKLPRPGVRFAGDAPGDRSREREPRCRGRFGRAVAGDSRRGMVSRRPYYRQGSTAFDWVGELWGGALYRTVLNKYYVDEAYAAGPVAATLEASRAAAWFDFHIIDWIVNFSRRDRFQFVALGVARPLRGRRAGQSRLQRDAGCGSADAAAADRIDQRLPVRNSGGGHVRPHRSRGVADVRQRRGGAAKPAAVSRNRR